ncbi:MAG: SUMF1/EgtB/PvdO family nonheme iron enzyme [Planctomycetota bacterium]
MKRLFAIAAFVSTTAGAQPRDYGIDFVTIGDPGNIAYNRMDPANYMAGRGLVGYEYRIGRTEITTGQWLEFVNTMQASGQVSNPFFALPFWWGAEADPTYDGPGRQFRLRSDLANAEMTRVQSIDWYSAAYYCNWLHNGKPDTFDAIQTGAYDASTWGDDTADPRLPGAQYWIPSVDEWQKAAYYDPNKYGDGDGEGGWWYYPDGSDTPLVPGLPGQGETTAGLFLDEELLHEVPIGSYPDVQSPWGLLDVSGSANEWTEDVFRANLPDFRVRLGTRAGDDDIDFFDAAWGYDFARPSNFLSGFRIASAVPSPASVTCFGLAGVVAIRRRR